MKFFKNLFNGSKEINERKEEVSQIVHKQKEKFTKQMWRIQLEAHKTKELTEKAKKQVDKLTSVVEDITAQYARATGGLK